MIRRPIFHPLVRQLFLFGLVFFITVLLDFAGMYADNLSLFDGLRFVTTVCAASIGWALNRRFTFRNLGRASKSQEWALYLLGNYAGLGVLYIVMVTFPQKEFWLEQLIFVCLPAWGLVSFLASKYIVFRPTP